MTRQYVLAFGKDFLDPKTVRKEAPAEKITAAFRRFHVLPLTQAEYAALDARAKAAHKKASGFVLGGEYGGAKTKADCRFKSIVTLDLDALTPESAQQCIDTLQAAGHSGFIYSTASHRPAAPRLRAFIFLARDVTPDEYVRLVDHYAGLLPQGAVSNESRKVGQLMYLPQRCSDGEEVFIELAGAPADPDPMLAAAPPLPERDSKVQPAREKPGIVGAVARLFDDDFDRAIVELKLPYERSKVGPTCAPGEDRYTYIHGTTADGAIYYRHDGHLFSYHGSDPCFGQNCTIFDVWRLHNAHPEQDDPAAPLHAKASHRTAQEWFLRRFPQLSSEVRTEPTADELDDLGPLPDDLEPSDEASEKPLKFKVIPAGEFSAGKPPAWWIKGVLPDAEIAMMYGASGSGKSFLAWDLACAIQRGVSWRGRRVRRGRVVYVCAEGMGGFRTRIKAYAIDKGVSMDDLPGVIAQAPNLLETDDVKELIRAIMAYGDVDLIIIDTFAATTPGSDENQSKDVGRALSHLKAIRRITGAMVLAVHHSGKDATRGARGWSGMRAAMDAELEVVRTGDVRVVRLTKSKDGRDGLFWGFALEIVHLGLDTDGDEVTSCVVKEIEVQVTASASRPALSAKYKEVYDAVCDFVKDNEPVEHAITFLMGTNIYDTGSDKSKKGNYRRAVRRLVKDGYLFEHKGGQNIGVDKEPTIDPAEFDDE